MSFAVMPIEDYKNTCDKVREKTGSEETIKSGELAGEVDKVFEKGQNELLYQMWQTVQRKGKRDVYTAAFQYWAECDKVFYPIYDIKPQGSINQIFGYFNAQFDNNGDMITSTALLLDLAERLKECGVILDTSKATTWNYAFNYAYVSNLPVLDMREMTTCTGAFNGCFASSIEKIILKETGQVLGNALNSGNYLKDITFEGLIIGNISIKSSNLTAESAKSAIFHLKNYAGTSEELQYTFSIHANVWQGLNESGAPPSEDTWENYVSTLGYKVASI